MNKSESDQDNAKRISVAKSSCTRALLKYNFPSPLDRTPVNDMFFECMGKYFFALYYLLDNNISFHEEAIERWSRIVESDDFKFILRYPLHTLWPEHIRKIAASRHGAKSPNEKLWAQRKTLAAIYIHNRTMDVIDITRTESVETMMVLHEACMDMSMGLFLMATVDLEESDLHERQANARIEYGKKNRAAIDEVLNGFTPEKIKEFIKPNGEVNSSKLGKELHKLGIRAKPKTIAENIRKLGMATKFARQNLANDP